MERRLAAILAADVAGYSRQMETAEERTAEQLAQCQSLIAQTADRLGGRVFNTAGDSALVEFSSPVNAVRCGVEIQRKSHADDVATGGSSPLSLRIGVHLADVIISGDDLIGDGVNVATRIQEAAEPSSVFASQSIFEQVRRNSPYVFEDLGLHRLKNISEEMRLYKVVGDMPTHRYKAGHAISDPNPEPARHGSLAVLPFEVIGGDEEQRYFADGLTDDLIVELAHFKSLFVISQSAISGYEPKSADPRVVGRELGVNHVLLGQVRRMGDRVRVSVRLVDADSGKNLWAERYERPWSELFDLLDELVARIAATIVGQVQSAGIAEARRKRPEDMTAYDYLLRGLEHHRLGGVTREHSREAVKWIERSIEADPNYGLSYAWWVCAASRLPEFDSDKGFAYINKALELDENNAEAHRIMASYQIWLGNFEAAEHHSCRAMALNPSNAYIRARSAAFYTFNGQPERSLELIAEAEALDPFLPVWCLEEKGVALFNLGQYEEAIAALNGLAFQTFRSRGYAAACALARGDKERARNAVAEAVSISPNWTVSKLLTTEYYRDPDDKNRLRTWLIEAGLPE
ncbi:MAG: adenylate/guanylate cyclase domain-containing protein [Alphaproteobacteria bacterium]|nr:adenylate/guanylate cyclase domain-containing protein [Alphaproteobacteria bacterium]